MEQKKHKHKYTHMSWCFPTFLCFSFLRGKGKEKKNYITFLKWERKTEAGNFFFIPPFFFIFDSLLLFRSYQQKIYFILKRRKRRKKSIFSFWKMNDIYFYFLPFAFFLKIGRLEWKISLFVYVKFSLKGNYLNYFAVFEEKFGSLNGIIILNFLILV